MKTSDISDLDVCKAYLVWRYIGKYLYEILMGQFGCPYKVGYAACKRADRKGLVDCGVSLRTGWLTEKGEQLVCDSDT